MDKYFKKELLPGYTGHIPAKKDVFGITSGEVNRQLVLGHPGIEKAVEGRQFYTEGKVVRGEGKDLDRLKFGLHSRDGVNWIAGPTNEIFPQHVPGYQGHVPGIESENLFAKSFARTTKKAICGNLTRGSDVPSSKRFTTLGATMINEKQHRRFHNPEDKELLDSRRDHTDYMASTLPTRTDSTMSASRLAFVPTVGYKGHLSTHRRPVTTISGTQGPEHPNFDLTATKARWVNTDYSHGATGGLRNVSQGFQNIIAPQENVKMPCVGYTGHMTGKTSQNFYGKSFRECTANSKRMQTLTHKIGSI